MTDSTAFPGQPVGGVSALVGACVRGALDGRRTVVRWRDLFAAAQGCDGSFDPTAEHYLSAFGYPRGDFVEHVRHAGSPRGYAGPAACPFLWFDIDRPDDLEAARADAATLVRFLLGRYPVLEPGLGVWFSGAKGFHVGLDCLPGYAPSPTVPAVAKRLALGIAGRSGVRIDPSIYDVQRLFRLPNSRHPATGLHKRPLSLDDLQGLDAVGIRSLAQHPAGSWLPVAGEHCQQLDDDWQAAADSLSESITASGQRSAPSDAPVVPDFVRRFISFGDIAEPGRAVTLFRCAAVLSEAGTPSAVVHGLLDEPALKSGLAPDEVRRQIDDGIGHGRGKGAKTNETESQKN